MEFYTSVHPMGDKMLVRGYDKGRAYQRKVDFYPTLYVTSKKESSWKTLDGVCVDEIKPGTIKETRDFVKRYEGVQGFDVYGNTNYSYQYISDMYPDDIKWDMEMFKVFTIDIETSTEGGFPDIKTANEEILLITVKDLQTKRIITFGSKTFVHNREDVIYVHANDERHLLQEFLAFWEKSYPDAVTGWNTDFFDIPYLINRIKKICGDDDAARLSPTKNIYSRMGFNKFGKEETVWIIDGVSCIDYLDAYRKFCVSPRENYKLDTIASVELGENKIDFGGGNLSDLADEDWETFVDYNIQDVRILVKLDDSLKYMDLLRSLSIMGLTTMESALHSIGVITGAAAIRARHHDRKIHTLIRDVNKTSKNEGAFVKEPESGVHNNLVSFDANSLYPNTMVTLNISPETKLGAIVDEDSEMVTIKDINDAIHKISRSSFNKLVEKESVAISKANILFTQKKKGLFPEIIDVYYKQRVDARKRMDKVNKLLVTEKDPSEIKKLQYESRLLDIKQHSLKIFLNSIYGAFGNKYFTLGDDDLARSITLSGQAIINQGSEILTKYVENLTGKKIEREVIRYIDTDSLFFSFDEIISHNGIKFSENGLVTADMYKLIDEASDHLNSEILKWGANEFNSKDCRIVFKREKICDVAMLLRKKHYILHILDNEGIACNKFKYTGVDVVKSTMPKKVKPYVKKIAETLLTTMNNQTTNDAVTEAHDQFLKLPLEEIATIKGIKNYEKYSKLCNEFQTTKGMPNHVKAAYYYNLLIERLELDNKYEKIQSGDKIKLFYLKKPNRFGIDAIAFKYYYPDEFKSLFEPDYEKMFDKVIFSPVQKFFEAVNWIPQKPNDMTTCDLVNFFAE